MRRFLTKLTSRMTITMLLILLQIFWFFTLLGRVVQYVPWISNIFYFFGLITILYIVNRNENPSYKIAWIITIFVFPLFGVLIYVFFGNKRPARHLRKKFRKASSIITENMRQPEGVTQKMGERDAVRAKYLIDRHFPVYENTETKYFTSGEEMWPSILYALSQAKHFIFLQYFIISEGAVWDSIREILEQKAAEGVDVRIIYDDVGSVKKMPRRRMRKLAAKGIKTVAFNPFVPIISVVMNNRDHRKMIVIDGHTAFTGGINLADEYMNLIHPYGYWKDTGIMLQGDAVLSFTYMFLQMWDVMRGTKEELEIYKSEKFGSQSISANGFTQPFSDSPLDDEPISQNVYIDIISQAVNYVYISTPYLVIDDEMKNALILAAKRGVDVRIITPGIPDKKIVFRLTRSYYPILIEGGVKIFEYTPGFVHAKSIVSDDKTAVVGTINLDYRSLYLHFECGVLMSGTDAVLKVRDDNIETFAKCRKIDKDNQKRNIFGRIFDSIVRTLAPLL